MNFKELNKLAKETKSLLKSKGFAIFSMRTAFDQLAFTQAVKDWLNWCKPDASVAVQNPGTKDETIFFFTQKSFAAVTPEVSRGKTRKLRIVFQTFNEDCIFGSKGYPYAQKAFVGTVMKDFQTSSTNTILSGIYHILRSMDKVADALYDFKMTVVDTKIANMYVAVVNQRVRDKFVALNHELNSLEDEVKYCSKTTFTPVKR